MESLFHLTLPGSSLSMREGRIGNSRQEPGIRDCSRNLETGSDAEVIEAGTRKQEVGDRSWCRGNGGVPLFDLLPWLAHPAFLWNPVPLVQGWHQPQRFGPSHTNHQSSNCTKNLPKVQPSGCLFINWGFLFQTLAYDRLI